MQCILLKSQFFLALLVFVETVCYQKYLLVGPDMELCLVRTTTFEKHLSELGKTGKKGAQAVDQAERIIEILPQAPWYSPEILYRRTKKGEMRIKRCEKYDLGGGHRLICARKGKQLFLLFVGTHDHCDRWLEHNKGMQFETDINEKSIFCEEKVPQLTETLQEEIEIEIDEYEQDLLKRIDDRTLQYVFRGFYKK